MAGVTQPNVFKAVKRGFLDLLPDRKINLTGPNALAWLANRRGKIIGPHGSSPRCPDGAPVGPVSNGDAALAERSASLQSRLFDVATLRANVIERGEGEHNPGIPDRVSAAATL